jgi:ATP synthase protein I
VSEHNDFDRRLQQARQKQGLKTDAEKAAEASSSGLPAGSLNIGMRAGVEVVSALIAGAGLGWLLDRWLGTFPWLFLVFFVVGGVAGVLNVYRLFNPRGGAR